ncbi:Tripartite motif containing 13 [Chionoecetes opilio]|uniref:Tripartite motif containing 13 n=1 Tax=Chionoecetes opilio TaxID=41210 RepID=A0A8J5D235_CHIOP|nr:Tripartite motif containing 13 [Chionoecetes opilio]
MSGQGGKCLPPVFGGDKSYGRWKTELEAWHLVTTTEKKKHALTVALSFPEGHLNPAPVLLDHVGIPHFPCDVDCAEKDTAESAHSLGTRPGQQGLRKRVRSLLEEQEAKILAAIHNCQKVKAQLNQYETTVRDWGREQQVLENKLQALMDQCKDARVLARQEELSASDKRQQVDHGEQQLHTVLQAVRTAASAGEAYETIQDADHVMEEETQREEECLARFPDVHTVTTLKKTCPRGAMEPARKGDKTAQLREGRRDSREDAVEDCPVCLTVFDEIGRRPRTLPCGHTFCTPCVNGLKEQGRVTCPNCRVEHPVPEAGQFPITYIVENLLRRMRGASLASPPPCAEKDTAESAHSLGTRPGQQGQKGLSKRVRSLLEEQEAKILAAIHSCQKVKAQLNQYETTVRDWGREQQVLEDRLQALMDQCKDARVLAQQEELSASDKRQQVDHGEQQLHTVLQAVRTAASAGEAIETIEDADHVMEEETQREEECLAMIPDVHTVTTIKKATEVAQAALEAAATVQAAQQTAGVGGGAAGDASLPVAAAASSIRDRVDALMSPPLRSSLHPAPQSLHVEDLRSLTQHARDLLQRGLVFAVHTTAGQSRQASLSLEDDRLYLHCLRDQPLPRGAVTLQVGQPLLSLPLSLPS